MTKWRVAAAVYLAIVVALIVAGFDLRGEIEPIPVLVLVALTLPFSLLSFFGLWALIHGADLGCFIVFYLTCATVNVWLAGRWLSRRRAGT